MDTDFSPIMTDPCVNCKTPPSCTQAYKITYMGKDLVNFPVTHSMIEVIHVITAKRQTVLNTVLQGSKCTKNSEHCPTAVIYADYYSQERYETPATKKLPWNISFENKKISELAKSGKVSK